MAIFETTSSSSAPFGAPPPPPQPAALGGSGGAWDSSASGSIAYGGAPTPGLPPTAVPSPPAAPAPTNATPPAGIAPGSTWVSTAQPGVASSQLMTSTPVPQYDGSGKIIGYGFGAGAGGYWALPASGTLQLSQGGAPAPTLQLSQGTAPTLQQSPTLQLSSSNQTPAASTMPDWAYAAMGLSPPAPAAPTLQETVTPYPAPAATATPAPAAPATDPTMSQGAPPWATSWASGATLPSFVNQPTAPLPSAQQWAGFSPTEQQAILSVAQSVGIPAQDFLTMMGNANPEWGQPAAAQYVAL